MVRFHQFDERNFELYKTFLKFRREGVGYKESIHLAAHSPCSKYWVSPWYFYKVFLDIRKGKSSCAKRRSATPERKKLEAVIYNDYLRLSQTRYFKGSSFHFLICFLLNQPAPSFYISDDRAEKIIRDMHHKYSKDKKYRTK